MSSQAKFKICPGQAIKAMTTDAAGVDVVIDATVSGPSVSFAVSEDELRGARRGRSVSHGPRVSALSGLPVSLM